MRRRPISATTDGLSLHGWLIIESKAPNDNGYTKHLPRLHNVEQEGIRHTFPNFIRIGLLELRNPKHVEVLYRVWIA